MDRRQRIRDGGRSQLIQSSGADRSSVLNANLNRRVWVIRLVWSLILVSGVALKLSQPTMYLFNAGFDDGLMVSMAHGFLLGHWSSTWQSTGYATMSKPVGYPLFLAGAHYLPWSPVVTVYLVYIIGALLISQAWNRISGQAWQATCILAMLVFNPIAFAAVNQRIYRDMLIAAMGTVAVGLIFRIVVLLLHPPPWPSPPRPGRLRLSDRALRIARSTPGRRARIAFLAFAAGIAAGGVVIIKPTWLWLMPAVAAPIIYPLVRLFRPLRPWALISGGLAALVFVAPIVGVTQTTRAMDRSAYHVSLTEDIATGSLARAWKLWASVEAGPQPRRYIIISHSMRMAVYKVSPTAALLRPFLESPSDAWRKVDCVSAVHICNDPGPWLEWDLMAAAFETGKVNSVSSLQLFYRRIASDISSNCHDGRLRCSSSPVLATGLPTLSRIPLGDVAERTIGGIWGMVWSALPMQLPPGTQPTRHRYALWRSVVPNMPPYGAVASQHESPVVSQVLDGLDGSYRAIDLGLLGVIVMGLLLAGRRSGREGGNPRLELGALGIALCLLLSVLIGIGMLAVFAAAQYTLFVYPEYWTDFAPEAQLCILFTVFAVWPVIGARFGRRGRHARSRRRRGLPVKEQGECAGAV